eukprot:scaffold4229_cov38-Cyclotella_meneghiniana.AAC.7
MQQQERSASYECSNYLARTQVIDPSHRQELCDWGYKTVEACNGVNPSTAVVAIGYFDRFLSSDSPAARRALNDVVECQLAFVTCLVIALKIHPGFNVESDFVAEVITNNAYDAKEINDMELEILVALGWKLNGPTPHDFIDYFLEVMPHMNGTSMELIRVLSERLVELAVTQYTTVMYFPSEIAFASICCVMHHVKYVLLADSLMFLQTITGLEFRDDNLRSLFQTMICLVRSCFPATRDCSPSSVTGE